MITQEEVEKLEELKTLLFEGIQLALAYSGHHKSYEGAVEIRFPNYFEYDSDHSVSSRYGITIHCYVLGPYRHYEFSGNTLSECLDLAIDQVNIWIENEKRLQEEEMEFELDSLDSQNNFLEDIENAFDLDVESL